MTNSSSQKAEGAWKKFRGRLQEAWGALSDDDLDRYEGRRDQLIGHIEKKTGEMKESIQDRIDKIAKKTKYNF